MERNSPRILPNVSPKDEHLGPLARPPFPLSCCPLPTPTISLNSPPKHPHSTNEPASPPSLTLPHSPSYLDSLGYFWGGVGRPLSLSLRFSHSDRGWRREAADSDDDVSPFQFLRSVLSAVFLACPLCALRLICSVVVVVGAS